MTAAAGPMLAFLAQTVRQAGRLSLAYRERLDELAIETKGQSPTDLVTEADRAVERFLRDALALHYPDHAIVGEEYGVQPGRGYRWIIDPIDGTTSFIHRQPFYSVSVAVEKDGRPHLAAVYAPVLDEMFLAEAGRGATLNGRPIRCSSCSRLEEALLATGFACIRSRDGDNNLPHFNRILPLIRGTRRLGSAAIDLCYVACGRLDGFWERNLAIYDIAAGALICTEAGGRVTDYHGRPDGLPARILATNGHLHHPLSALLTEPT